MLLSLHIWQFLVVATIEFERPEQLLGFSPRVRLGGMLFQDTAAILAAVQMQGKLALLTFA